jgi:hypothetical protein
MTSRYMVIRAKRPVSGLRFDTKEGELKRIRYGYDKPDTLPRLVRQCRSHEAIDWGGASVQPQDYEILFDGPAPLPMSLR